MELELAKKNVMSCPEVKNLKGFFLGSVFSMIEEGSDINEWTFLFYNPATGKVRDCLVNDRSVVLDEERPARAKMKELKTDGIKIPVNKALETAKNKYPKKTINVLITLHSREKPTWTITFIGADITATSYDIDALTGEITHEETANLTRRL